jgi:hypothetical protein
MTVLNNIEKIEERKDLLKEKIRINNKRIKDLKTLNSTNNANEIEEIKITLRNLKKELKKIEMVK